MPSSVSRHDAQTVTTFTFESMNQTPRFFVSEFGGFTTPVAEHGPLLILKIGHSSGTQPSSAACIADQSTRDACALGNLGASDKASRFLPTNDL